MGGGIGLDLPNFELELLDWVVIAQTPIGECAAEITNFYRKKKDRGRRSCTPGFSNNAQTNLCELDEHNIRK
jgi:hypothetical protein